MGCLDIGDHGEVGPPQAREIGNLARMVHPKLKHGIICILREPGETERRSDMIVQIANAGMDRA